MIITLLPVAVWLLWWVMSGVSDVLSIAPEIRWIFIAGVVSLAAMVTPSRMFRISNLSREGVYYAMLPASKLEKYVSMLIMSVVVCPLVCFCGSMVIDYFLALLPFGPYSKWLWQTDYLAEMLDHYRLVASGNAPGMEANEVRVLSEVLTPCRVVLGGVASYLSMVALFMFTNTIFKKHKFLQTVLWVVLINFVLNLIVTPIMFAMTIRGNWVESIMASSDPIGMLNTIFWISLAWELLLAVVFFGWAAYRLKNMKY